MKGAYTLHRTLVWTNADWHRVAHMSTYQFSNALNTCGQMTNMPAFKSGFDHWKWKISLFRKWSCLHTALNLNQGWLRRSSSHKVLVVHKCSWHRQARYRHASLRVWFWPLKMWNKKIYHNWGNTLRITFLLNQDSLGHSSSKVLTRSLSTIRWQACQSASFALTIGNGK